MRGSRSAGQLRFFSFTHLQTVMPRRRANTSYASIVPSHWRRASNLPAEAKPAPVQNGTGDCSAQPQVSFPISEAADIRLKRGHTFSFAALFAFTLVLYARPSEFYPSAVTASMALVIALITFAWFIPTQLSLEGNITAMLPEVRLVFVYAAIGLIGMPLAMSPADAWLEFSGIFIRCIVIFIVLVNVVRTEARLNGLLYLALITAVWLSVGAVNDYRLGLLTVEGYRASGRGQGIFGNSNDMALFLVIMVPVAVAFLLRARSKILKAVFAATSLLMITATMLTYSRGAFLGLLVALAFMAWRLGNQHRAQILVGGFLLAIAVLILAPGGYGERLASIFVPSLDARGSAEVRRGDLLRSLYIAIRHPVLGIGMGNYASQMSYTGLVTHNSYTQVAAEMGLAALCCYTMFIVAPLRKLGQIARNTLNVSAQSRFHFIAVGLQASLIAYMVSSFFLSVAYTWYVFYLVGYAVCLRRIYEAETGVPVVVQTRSRRQGKQRAVAEVPQTEGAIG